MTVMHANKAIYYIDYFGCFTSATTDKPVQVLLHILQLLLQLLTATSTAGTIAAPVGAMWGLQAAISDTDPNAIVKGLCWASDYGIQS